jgi:hypothetical protein
MQREAAKKLIRDTFEQPFNKEQFTSFAKNLLNHLEPAPFPRPRSGQMIFEDFRSHIASFDRIGKYTDSDGNKLDVLVVNLSKTSSVDRARATQRKFVAKYLKESQGAQLKDAALVAFVSPNEEDWRFSFVKMDYRIETTEKGRVKVKEEFTPARRYSFLVGQNENSHTAQSQLLPILENTDKNPSLVDLENAFRIEKVTKEFFEQYRELYHNTKIALDELVAKDKEIRADFETKGVDTVDFAKKLLGQIVFLYFLQKKGWFGVKRKAAWGTGSKAFLRELFLGNHGKYKNFFNDILEPLFYNTLAVERPENYADRFDCKIPFLNGGLFDPLNNYDWVDTEILLPNDLFSNEEKTKQGDIGTGILDVFDRYNFTVKEDEPLEKEVAVDPEMLGKVFENLLEVKDRKSKGTYYTPREIVHYMCQESLINYLATELENTVPREDIETLIKHGETFIDHDVVHLEKVSTNPNYKGRYEELRLGESVKRHAELIDRKLANIKVCDPAVGSGAFLVGMMSEIVRTRMVLTQFMGNGDRSTYDLKRHAIQNSLYGVDIDLGAVEIAKLRLWLSLIVDEEDYKQIKPLPNLDYKIMQGNSLLEEYEGIKLIDERFFEKQEEKAIVRQRLERDQSKLQREYIQLNSERKLTKTKKAELEKKLKEIEKTLKELDKPRNNSQDELGLYGKSEVRSKADRLLKLHEQFFSAYNKRQKDQIKRQIDELTWDLIETTLKQQGRIDKLENVRRFQQTNTRPFFLWKLNFADVFGDRGGFDVIIANPPYVRQEQLKEIKPALKNRYRVFTGTADIYTYFFEAGYDILRRNGFLTFITSNKYMRANYGENLRSFLKNHVAIKTLIDFGDLPVFDATAYPSILVIQKEDRGNSFLACSVETLEELSQLEKTLAHKSIQMSQIDLPESAVWSIENPQVGALRQKLEGNPGNTKLLKEYVQGKMFRGILTGYNKAFVIDGVTRERLINDDPRSSEVIKPFLRGRDIKRYCITSKDLYVIYIPNNWTDQHRGKQPPEKYLQQELPAIYHHLIPHKAALKKRDDQGRYWWELRACAYLDKFEKPKITWGNLATEPQFALDTAHHYVSAPACIIPTEDLFLLALLNSHLCGYMISSMAALRAQNYLEFKPMYVERVPIRIPSQPMRNRIEACAAEILDRRSRGKDTSTPERQVDRLVYELYGLTEQEIEIVERAGKGRV